MVWQSRGMVGCPSCHDIAEADEGRYPWAVARLRAGYVWLNPCQYYPGAMFYVARRCIAELHELSAAERQVHLMEMADVAAAVHHEFGARKMNYEALGNTVAALALVADPRPHVIGGRADRSGRISTSCGISRPAVLDRHPMTPTDFDVELLTRCDVRPSRSRPNSSAEAGGRRRRSPRLPARPSGTQLADEVMQARHRGQLGVDRRDRRGRGPRRWPRRARRRRAMAARRRAPTARPSGRSRRASTRATAPPIASSGRQRQLADVGASAGRAG